jgi:hypothetical protein
MPGLATAYSDGEMIYDDLQMIVKHLSRRLICRNQTQTPLNDHSAETITHLGQNVDT